MEKKQPSSVVTETPKAEREEKKTPRLQIQPLETRVAPFAIWGD
jgi:hypothetical protein